jgi:aromatic-amino-acid transaminase
VGKVGLAFAWSASKSYTQYGARVGALVVVDPDVARRKRTQDSLTFSCRGTWSNCNHAGMLAVARLVSDSELRVKVEAERAGLKRLLDGRVQAFNGAAKSIARGELRYPRYDGGFFSTVFVPEGRDPLTLAASLRDRGVFLVPQGQGLRIGLCSVPERDVPRLVEALAATMT